MTTKLRVGIIGANPNGSWGANAHLPALAALPGFEATAIATAHLETAQETARKFNIPNAFDNPTQLAECPDVDIISVCVRVPKHRELVKVALDAGKHVYCEWPLGRDTAEAEAMLLDAKAKGVVHIVGLQARRAPVLLYMRDLIADGAIGEVHSVNLRHAAPWHFAGIPSAAYLMDRSSGAHFLSIPGGHSIDAICHIFGEFGSLCSNVTWIDRGINSPLPRPTTANHISIIGELKTGIAANIRLSGAPQHGTGVQLEVHGTKGDFVVSTSAGGRGIQMSDLTLQRTVGTGVLKDMPLPDKYYGVPEAIRSNPPLNVAKTYLAMAEAVQTGKGAAPDFAAAIVRHKTLDAVERAAREDRRILLS